MLSGNKIYHLYHSLYRKHGDPGKFWPQWCAGKKSWWIRELIAMGAILTQRTSWHNADLALRNLKKANLLSVEKIARLTNLSQLTDLLKPAGFFQTKPRCLYDFCTFVIREYKNIEALLGENLGTLRQQLLALRGIGPETADTILLYALDRPTFVIDEYTKRLVKKEKLAKKLNYDFLKELFEKNLPRDVSVYQNFHALIIIAQKGEEGSKMKKIRL